jgi:hypothetical protein
MAKRKRPSANASEGSIVTRDGVRFVPVAPAREPQVRTVTASWHAPMCTTCGVAIDDITLAMAQWRRDDGTGENFSPAVNCKMGDDETCAARFWNQKGVGWHPQDLNVADLRRSPMDAIFVALRGRHKNDEDMRLWAAWVSVVLGLPFNAWDSIVMLAAKGEAADQMIERVPVLQRPSPS